MLREHFPCHDSTSADYAIFACDLFSSVISLVLIVLNFIEISLARVKVAAFCRRGEVGGSTFRSRAKNN